MFLLAGAYALRTRGRADREQIWAGMAQGVGAPARNAALEHQRLDRAAARIRARADDGRGARPHGCGSRAARRVAHRFERIGRPPRQEAVDIGELVDRVATYFRARVPTLAQRVTDSSSHQGDLTIQGDAVLIEWALESLVKNAIDALAGRDGKVEISAAAIPEGRVRVRVADDGPGVARDIRNQIFDPGFSTKEKGWGIGLSLARRIVRDSHGGELLLVPSERGATFDMVLG